MDDSDENVEIRRLVSSSRSNRGEGNEILERRSGDDDASGVLEGGGCGDDAGRGERGERGGGVMCNGVGRR